MSRNRFLFYLLTVVVAMVTNSPIGAQPATTKTERPQVKYPIVFKDTTPLLALGIAFHHDEPGFKNKCYAYGEGSYRFSVSDDLIARYKAKGFSHESLCMGLVSEARYDPESGKRLPTFIHFDVSGLRKELSSLGSDAPASMRKYKGRDPATFSAKELLECCESLIGFIAEELPLTLPPCFKNGNPYSDCVWRYAMKSGQRLSDESVEKFRNLGRAIDAAMKRALTEKPVCKTNYGWPCGPAKRTNEFGELETERLGIAFFINSEMLELYPAHRPIPDALLKGNDLSFLSISPTFPRGYAYALNADGSAGPSVSNASLRSVAEGRGQSPQIDMDALRRLIGE